MPFAGTESQVGSSSPMSVLAPLTNSSVRNDASSDNVEAQGIPTKAVAHSSAWEETQPEERESTPITSYTESE
ncbi:hypothetical protein CBOM_05070 [Ceraceosorus bombacis]|uniref:Uncharacterized protein n=1 Tax=Ceraceosorus bombacis TaxID=401625 RepID=A0A0P1BHW1_9BASI|nr:hypothetical protein CBOM_05070 [Ceraceosorus bombacis]